MDILEKAGWWEQPADWDQKSPWKFHPFPFAPGQGGAQMFAYDIDGDGVKDIVTGKRFYAHNGKDPGAEDPAVLYWFRTARQPDGSVEFIPYLIDDDSGVGCQVSTGDLNGDNKIDIVISNKKGVFVFIQQ